MDALVIRKAQGRKSRNLTTGKELPTQNLASSSSKVVPDPSDLTGLAGLIQEDLDVHKLT